MIHISLVFLLGADAPSIFYFFSFGRCLTHYVRPFSRTDARRGPFFTPRARLLFPRRCVPLNASGPTLYIKVTVGSRVKCIPQSLFDFQRLCLSRAA